MARLLTLLLLYKAGFEVGRYISLEMIVDETRDSYYDVLMKSSRKWHQGRHNLVPWTEYLLGVVVLGAYREFENRAGMITTARGAKRQMVLEVIRRMSGEFTLAQVHSKCPGVSIDLIRKVMQDEKKAGRAVPVKMGRDATWLTTVSYTHLTLPTN